MRSASLRCIEIFFFKKNAPKFCSIKNYIYICIVEIKQTNKHFKPYGNTDKPQNYDT